MITLKQARRVLDKLSNGFTWDAEVITGFGVQKQDGENVVAVYCVKGRPDNIPDTMDDVRIIFETNCGKITIG